jgi:hypothetical protein
MMRQRMRPVTQKAMQIAQEEGDNERAQGGPRR